MKTLRVGVIGLGFIGNLHARILSEIPNAELICVSDIQAEISKSYASKFNCQGYTDYQEMIEKNQLDAVTITLPDQFHEEAAVFCLEKGVNVLLEKPIAPTLDAAERILEAAKKHGTRLMVAQILHFDPRYAQLQESIRRGELGNITHMFFKRTNPRANAQRVNGQASVMYYIGVHDFEMLCSYSSSKATKVYCKKVQKINAHIPSEDSVFAMIDFEDGSVGVVELCWALPNNDMLGINTYAEVVGSLGAGYVEIQNQGLSIITPEKVVYPDILHWPEYNGQILGDLKEELSHFVTSIIKGQPFLVDNNHALQAAAIIDACFESIESGNPCEIKVPKKF